MAPISPPPQNNKFFDLWSIAHIAVGTTMGIIGLKRKYAYPIIIGTEVIENLILRKIVATSFNEQEKFINIIGDLALTTGSYELMKNYDAKLFR